jgi:prophage regulatory protein
MPLLENNSTTVSSGPTGNNHCATETAIKCAARRAPEPRRKRREPAVAKKTSARVGANEAGQPPPIRFVFKPEVLDRTGMTYPTLWAWMRKGEFPQSYDVGGKVAWRENEIDAWCASRPVRKLKPAKKAG